MGEQPRDAHPAIASPKRPVAGTARRRLPLGASVLLVAAAVLTGLVASRDDFKVPTPSGIQAHPSLRALGSVERGLIVRFIGSRAGLAYGADGHTIATSDCSGLLLWDAATHHKRADLALPGTPAATKDGATTVTPGAETVGRFDLSPDGRSLAILIMRGDAPRPVAPGVSPARPPIGGAPGQRNARSTRA
ncbi:MAG: hypothetical protein ACRDNL_14475, partial [Spirillospora sp.]